MDNAPMHTPWKVTDNADNYHAKPVAIETDDGRIVACNTSYYPTGLDADDAAHIVACVNALPELLAALRGLLSGLGPSGYVLPAGEPATNRARRALAAWEATQ